VAKYFTTSPWLTGCGRVSTYVYTVSQSQRVRFSLWRKLQVAKGGQGAYVSSKVRMGIARHSGLLFILFLVVCNYKHGSQIIVQHYIVKWSHCIVNDAMRRHYITGDAMWSSFITTDVTRRHYITSDAKGVG